MKNKRSEVNLAAIKILRKLAFQELVPFSTDKTLTLSKPFIVETNTYSNGKKNDNPLNESLWSCLTGDTNTTEIDLPTWAGTQALLSDSKLPFQNLNNFAKCVQKYTGKYIKGRGIENALVEKVHWELK